MDKKLLIGLGNWPKEYKNTRHNAGFMVLDEFLSTKKISLSKHSKLADFVEENGVVFCKPLTLMNLSGLAVKELMKKYNISNENLYVIQDEINLECGKIKIKNGGSSGGHNGIKNIIENVGSENFIRIKIGVGLKQSNEDLVQYVLGVFSSNELALLKKIFAITNAIITDIIENNLTIEQLMNKYNG